MTSELNLWLLRGVALHWSVDSAPVTDDFDEFSSLASLLIQNLSKTRRQVSGFGKRRMDVIVELIHTVSRDEASTRLHGFKSVKSVTPANGYAPWHDTRDSVYRVDG